ncbi:MAG: 30S ribosomal protein S16 [Candidatus Pacebacteria bacterium RIFCSPHIGHO2_01_FULL_46_10]|nr:MAG: 30S ribosomal protein S16 [Candidatus Pacebacteria bacterium RIFCSPHIGHO2_01_FULL_46_10]
MVKIKLMRTGRTHQTLYRIVVVEERSKLTGKYVDLIGHYNPSAKPKQLLLDKAKYDAWLKKGAQPTETVASLAKRQFAEKIPAKTK